MIATKAWTGSGTPLRGGLPSGHAAIAFAGWMAATLRGQRLQHRFLISSLTFVMALLVAQTRVESGVHSALEVMYGGALGALVTLVRLPGVRRDADPSSLAGADAAAEQRVRAVLEVPRRRAPCAARRARRRRRERRERRLSARRLRRADGDREGRRAKACGPGDIDAIGITASPCGGCRQWLHEWRIERVYFRREDGSIAEYAPAAKLLPDAWDLP